MPSITVYLIGGQAGGLSGESGHANGQNFPRSDRSHTAQTPDNVQYINNLILADPVVIILATGSEVRGFKSGRGRWIFLERKNPEFDFLRKGSKALGPVSYIYGTQKNLKPKLGLLSKICRNFHAHCRKRR